jgi:hypothetical protein
MSHHNATKKNHDITKKHHEDIFFKKWLWEEKQYIDMTMKSYGNFQVSTICDLWKHNETRLRAFDPSYEIRIDCSVSRDLLNITGPYSTTNHKTLETNLKNFKITLDAISYQWKALIDYNKSLRASFATLSKHTNAIIKRKKLKLLDSDNYSDVKKNVTELFKFYSSSIESSQTFHSTLKPPTPTPNPTPNPSPPTPTPQTRPAPNHMANSHRNIHADLDNQNDLSQ